jgi:hypothetical protein
VLAESAALARARLAAAGRQAMGSVLFSGNQVSLSLGDADSDAPASAVVVMSNGDVSVSDNQVDATVPVTAGFINTLVYGATVRVLGNRFNEPMQSARDSVLSAATVSAALNITTGNEGAHCIYAYRRPGSAVPRVVDQPNISMVQLTSPEACARFSAATVNIGSIMAAAWPQFASMQQSDEE